MPRSRKKRRQPVTKLILPTVVMTSEEENSDLDVDDMLEGGMEASVQFLTDLNP